MKLTLKNLSMAIMMSGMIMGSSAMAADSNEKIVIAHRGASGYLPEHTLPAKAMAYAQGADYLEQDLVMTKDDHLVVLHDHYLDRVTDVADRFPDRARKDGRYYAIDFTLDEIRPSYWKEQGIGLCGKSVPQALQAFFESTDFESAIRLAVSIGGDTDTLGAIAGAPAGAFYHVPESIAQEALAFLPEELRSVLEAFEAAFPT